MHSEPSEPTVSSAPAGFPEHSEPSEPTAPHLQPDTIAVSAGRPAHQDGAPVNTPVTFTSIYVAEPSPDSQSRIYGRFANPTWDAVEDTVAELEGAAVPGLLFSSGVGAINSVLDTLAPDALVLMADGVYNGTRSLAERAAERGRIRLRFVKDEQEALAALTTADPAQKPTLIWLELPANPLLAVWEVPTLVSAANERGVLSVVDSTLATPLGAQPLSWGTTAVLHSASKYLGGHSDVVLGVVLTNDQEFRDLLHSQRTLAGTNPSPMDAWLLLRGIRTLAVRMERHWSNAQELAARLAQHPALTNIRYPGLPTDPYFATAERLGIGPGAVISIEVGTDASHADRFLAALQLWTPATSLGGVESTAERRRRHASEPQNVPENLVRLSVGIENVEDLWADLNRALDTLS